MVFSLTAKDVWGTFGNVIKLKQLYKKAQSLEKSGNGIGGIYNLFANEFKSKIPQGREFNAFWDEVKNLFGDRSFLPITDGDIGFAKKYNLLKEGTLGQN